MRRPLALVIAAALGVGLGCVVDLEPRRDCGDGYVDELAGEDCEPARPDSLAGFCPAGQVPGPGACHPETCVFDRDACTLCGNGSLDPGEECDPKDMSPPACPFGGVGRCRSDCTIDRSGCARHCGDGVVDLDLGEECDWGPEADVTDKGVLVDCRTLTAPSTRGYGSGQAACVGCTWDRSGCSYCGNDRLENQAVITSEDLHVQDDPPVKPIPEVCDRDHRGEPIADLQAWHEHCRGADVCDSFVDVECRFACVDECRAFGPPTEGELECCTARGADCPYEGGVLKKDRRPCCNEDAHPGQDPCAWDDQQHWVCR